MAQSPLKSQRNRAQAILDRAGDFSQEAVFLVRQKFNKTL
jgi:hypothetical protein